MNSRIPASAILRNSVTQILEVSRVPFMLVPEQKLCTCSTACVCAASIQVLLEPRRDAGEITTPGSSRAHHYHRLQNEIRSHDEKPEQLLP